MIKSKLNTINKSTGFIMLIVVGLLGILAFISITFLDSASKNNHLTSNNLLKIRAKLLSRSGYDMGFTKIGNNFLIEDQDPQQYIVGEGTLTSSGDSFEILVKDANAMININDGIKAGIREMKDSDQSNRFYDYHADALDPWPDSIYEQPIKEGSKNYSRARSALINLRLRRLLNAYGDVHRFLDFVFDGDFYNVNRYPTGRLPSTPHVFSTRSDGSDGRRGYSMSSAKDLTPGNSYNNGLGDRIIEARPQIGYRKITEIKAIVNRWSRENNLTDKYLKEEGFFDLIKKDLCVHSFEDDQFFRIDDEKRFGDFDKSDQMDHVDFEPKDLQIDPPNFDKMWIDHSVPLINLTKASFPVLAAVFYAPTNVSYLCEGATTLDPYPGDKDHFDTHTAKESAMLSPSIGVGPPVFLKGKEKQENGVAGVGRRSHLMSLRDAMNLAFYFIEGRGENIEGEDEQIYKMTFDQFPYYLWLSGRLKDFERVYPESYPIEPGEPPPPPHPYLHGQGIDYDANWHFFVSSYDQRGVFYQDYVQKTLPHILSCVRRIPGYLGAPEPLLSPYIVVKPEINRSDYINGGLCRQAFRKVEDFVWRFTHPKVCFVPCGFYALTSFSQIKDANGHDVITSHIQTTIKQFETNYFRTQKDFLDHTESMDPDIRIGPEFVTQPYPNSRIQPSRYLGFVGLKDFNQEIDEDIFIRSLGLKPQIVMNFDHDDGHHGFFNSAKNPAGDITPIIANPATDKWRQELPNHISALLNDSHLEGSDHYFLTDTRDKNKMCDLSPFNGLFLSSLNHGAFTQGGFNDSLYWRLDEWFPFSTIPTGLALSSGVMTFWFRAPTGYDYVHHLKDYEPTTASRVLVSLNLWERYEPTRHDPPEDRSVTITVGLKKTKRQGLNIFARYDTGGAPYSSSIPIEDHGYWTDTHHPLGISLYSDINPQYDFLGFRCSDSPGFVAEADLYETYRARANRSSEVSVPFGYDANEPVRPGAWSRVTIFWNLRYEGDHANLSSDKQLWIFLHNKINEQKISSGTVQEYHQTVATPPFYGGDDDELSGGLGMMQPYDATMTLSIGEAHGRRLLDFQNELGVAQKGTYTPFWRLNSCIDNLWIQLSPRAPNACTIPIDYFLNPADPNLTNFPEGFAYGSTMNFFGTNASALRYNVTESGLSVVTPSQPLWKFDPKIPTGSELLSIGTRLYRPRYGNTPHVQIEAPNHTPYPRDTKLEPSPLEDELFYPGSRIDENFTINFQYKAHEVAKPNEKLLYTSWNPRIQGINKQGHLLDISWIKEVSVRYRKPGKATILTWEEN